MRTSPGFWWRSRGIIAYALALPAFAYGRVAAARMKRRGARARLPVICVGNFVVGGGGKTPTALAIADLLESLGRRPGFLTRGYGGRRRGPIKVDPDTHLATDVGDEPLLLAARAPTVVARNRRAGAAMLADLGVDTIVMDDGFQNPALKKDLALVAVDAEVGVGNGMTFPAGPLRAPLSGQLAAADAIIRVGTGHGAETVVRAAARMGLPIINAVYEPVRKRGFKSRKYLAFAGIARPEKFFRTLEEAGVTVVITRQYADHQVLKAAECRLLLNTAEEGGLSVVTTEKDAARLRGGTGVMAELAAAVQVFPVRIRFEEERRLLSLIEPLFQEGA